MILLASMGGMGGGMPCGRFPFPPCPVPLNTYEIVLLTIGGMWGMYKLYKSLKPTK